MATPISYLVTGSGHVLPPHGALHGALADQEEITAIVGQWPKVAASMTAFACVKAGSGERTTVQPGTGSTPVNLSKYWDGKLDLRVSRHHGLECVCLGML